MRGGRPAVAALFVVLCGLLTLGSQSRQSALPPGNAPLAPPIAQSRSPQPPVSFNNQVVRILQAHCQSCHQPGDIAPFPLVTYADAYANRQAIRDQTSRRLMPPWKVDSACAAFEDDRSLSQGEIDVLGRWVEAGALEGDPKDLPAPLSFPTGWSLGEPDLALRMQEPATPSFDSGDVYRCFVMPTGLAADRFVTGVEVAPGNRQMVHHVLLFIDTGTTAQELDRRDPGPGYSCFGGPGFAVSGGLGGWVPGNLPRYLPEGVGILLPRDSWVVMQVHYSARSGVTGSDQTSVGLHFARSPIQKRFLTIPVVNQNFEIPAGAPDWPVAAAIPFIPFDVHLLAVTPHMHLLGRTMRVTATRPAPLGTACLVEVPAWDFNWQGTYFYKEPVAVPAGSRIDLLATYDNSPANPNNPNNPPKPVRWGENTTDEMCIAFVSFTLDSENLSGASGLAPTSLGTFFPFWERPGLFLPQPAAR